MLDKDLQDLKLQVAKQEQRLVHAESEIIHLWSEIDTKTKERNDAFSEVRTELNQLGDLVSELRANTAATNEILKNLKGLNEKVDEISKKQFRWSSLFWAFGVTGGIIWALLANVKDLVVKWLS